MNRGERSSIKLLSFSLAEGDLARRRPADFGVAP